MGPSDFILLAEDDHQELIRLAVSEVTDQHTFEIMNNDQEALGALGLQSNLAPLIILNLNMAALKGMQILAALERESRFTNIPKVILTTSENEDNKTRSHSPRAVDYFVKPSTVIEFVKQRKEFYPIFR